MGIVSDSSTAIKALTITYLPILATDPLIDINVSSVVTRALIYMNRYQLVSNYDAAVISDAAGQPIYDITGNQIPLSQVPVPMPSELQVILASTVIQAYKTQGALNAATTGFVNYISDNGQEQRYLDKVMSFLTTQTDTNIFAGTTDILDKYRLPEIIENTNQFQNTNLTNLLR